MGTNLLNTHGWVSCQVLRRSTGLIFPTTLWRKPGILYGSGPSPISCDNAPPWCCSCRLIPSCPMAVRRQRGTSIPTPCGIGGDAGLRGSSVWQIGLDEAGRPGFPPLDGALVKAMACEAVHQTGLPLSRLSTADIAGQASRALGKPISPSTVWRILDADALKPWQYKYWIFPRDPHFAEKAGRVVDLYAGYWQGAPLGPQDHIISADEKTSIQARIRCYPSLPPAPRRAQRIEHEYARGGALQYLAAWDVRQGLIMGRCEPKTGIEPFGRLVEQVMEREPYKGAERVFWVVDNGSSHRGQAAVRRLATAYANLIVVHTPVHASWLNQVEIYFSIVQRKVLTPNDFASLEAVEQRLRLYEALTNRQPRPFEWKFTRAKLADFLKRLATHEVMVDQGDAAPGVPDANQEEPLAA
jgi:DDE superfamily endonuclease